MKATNELNKVRVTKSWKFEIYHVEYPKGVHHNFESKGDLKAFCYAENLEIESVNELVTGKSIEI